MRNTACFLLGLLYWPFSGMAQQDATELSITNLRCEYLVSPIGIDVATPRLSWELVSDKRGKSQSAYQIMVSEDSLWTEPRGILWNSGRVRSAATNQITYRGKPLQSGKRYYWKVRVWDEAARASGWSAPEKWSMGILKKSEWLAKWIGDTAVGTIQEQDKHIIPVSPLLRKEFDVRRKIQRATLYATALGIYEVYINGKKAGDRCLAPEWTNYSTRLQYQSYDVTALLQPSRNAIGAMLTDGWYAGELFTHQEPQRGNYGYNRRFLAQMHIEYADGSSDTIVTDESWKISREGPVREASLFGGETYDARYGQDGWCRPGFDDRCWSAVTTDLSIPVLLNAQMNEPVKVVQELHPVAVFRSHKNTYIFDMGQNMAGWIRLSLSYNPGFKISIRHGEMLDLDSTLYTRNLRSALQTDVYIPGKEPRIAYEPRFTYHGFRYVEISGLTRPPDLNAVTGKVLASSSAIASRMETSNSLLNKLWNNILWTQRGNMHSIPEDCPQRDERCGWMGDAQVFCQTAMYNMDMAAFYTKWFRDIRDGQTPEGRFPNYAPQVGMAFYDAPGWADAGVIIPWKFYLNYGDKTILQEQYDAMCRFIDWVHDRNPGLIRVNSVGQNYGDWLNGNSIEATDYPGENGEVPKDVYSTAYFAYSAQLLANASKVLGKAKEYKHYDSLARAIRNVFAREFINSEGVVKGNTQAGYAMALEFNLVPQNLRKKAASHLLNQIKAYDYRISTGIHTTARLMNQLSELGFDETAYKLVESDRFPSWLYSIKQGATTIWERWDGYVKGRGFQSPGMNSFNHYAIGSVGEWMYGNILGIRSDGSDPGYRNIIISPKPGGSLLWARGSYHSINGAIEVSWKRADQHITFEVEIPANTRATLILPTTEQVTEGEGPAGRSAGVKKVIVKDGKTTLLLQSGRYSFQIKEGGSQG